MKVISCTNPRLGASILGLCGISRRTGDRRSAGNPCAPGGADAATATIADFDKDIRGVTQMAEKLRPGNLTAIANDFAWLPQDYPCRGCSS